MAESICVRDHVARTLNIARDRRDQVAGPSEAQLAAAIYAILDHHGICPDPDVWVLMSDRSLLAALGPFYFDVLNTNREKLIPWLSQLCHPRADSYPTAGSSTSTPR